MAVTGTVAPGQAGVLPPEECAALLTALCIVVAVPCDEL